MSVSGPEAEEILAVLGQLAQRVRPSIGPLERAHRLVDDLALDSIEILSLAVEIEDHFQVQLDDLDDGELTTVDELVLAIASRRPR